MQMTTETDPRVTEAQQWLEQSISAIEDEQHRADNQSFKATDDANTVEVVINGKRWLTGLYIEPGLLRLGAETVQQRILEALQKAQSDAFEAGNTAGEQVEEIMGAMLGGLGRLLGDLPTG
jgi:DNA-binding protein YbaB